MKHRKLISLLLALAMLFALAACSGGGQEQNSPNTNSEQPSESPENSDGTEERTVTVTDMSGDEVTITGEVERIVNLWPAGTSSFFVMGAGDLLCGLATDPTNAWSEFFYPEIADIPVLGGTSPSTEDIINLDPDLVIIHPTTAKDGFAQQLRELGIPAININFSNYETMAQAYTILGTILGGEYQEKLSTWCAAIQEKADSHRELTSGLSEEEKPVVYYIAGQSENLLSTMGAASTGTTNIMQDWVESNGGLYGPAVINLAGNEITAEQVFAMNPDVIMVGGIYQHVLLDQVMNSDGWKDLDAVKNGRVYNNPYACFNWDRFGMESLLQADYAFMCLQPEIAAEQGVDRDYMINTVIEFYEYYNGTVLTEEQAGFMLDGLMPDGTAEIPAA